MSIKEEKDLFNFLKNYLPDLTKSSKKFSKWDCYSPKARYRIELKCRRTHYDELVIEKAKYDALIANSQPYQDTPIYICSTPKGIWVFHLDKIPTPKWFLKSMPATTDFDRSEYINKEVGMIPLIQGKQIN